MKVTFSNFRCLRETSLELGQLTILVGPNASGKTSICAALNRNFQVLPRDVWQRRPETSAYVTRDWPEGGLWKSEYNARQHASTLGGSAPTWEVQYLRLDPLQLRMSNQVEEDLRLSTNGDNLTSVFVTLPRRTQEEVVRWYARLVPVFSDVVATPSPSSPGQMRLRFQDRWNPDCWYEPKEVSDGSMLALALLLLQFQNPPPAVIAIEDPDHGLHPYLMGDVLELLRRIANGEGSGQKPLIVLTTHSAELLNFAKPEEVRFLVRQADGSVVIKQAPTNSPEWSTAYEEYQRSLGGMWLSGSMGGVP